VARAKQARENLQLAEKEAAERATEEKLKRIQLETDEHLAKQKAQDQQ
jgi:hypothetical protein